MNKTRLPSNIKKIFFVCTGNICRSAMAEAVMNHKNTNKSHLMVSSAGTDAVQGRQPPEEAIVVGREFGVDISNHKAKRLTESIVKKADILIVMEPYHREYIISLVPNADRKIFYLGFFSKKNIFEIADPYGSGIDTYRFCFHLIEECVDNLYHEIIDK